MPDRLHFLDLPELVRNQIYNELLVPPIYESNGKFKQDRPFIDILYTNKQIYAESSDILYSQNLFTIISANLFDDFGDVDRAKIPIILDVKDPDKIKRCARFAMELEFLTHTSVDAKAEGTPMIVISARALPHFASGIVQKYRFHSHGSGMLLVKTNNSFRYTDERLSELLLGRFLQAPQLPKFWCIQFEGPVSENHRYEVMQKCISTERLVCAGYYSILYSMSGYTVGRSDYTFAQQLEFARRHIRMQDIFWESHVYQARRGLGHRCGSAKPAYLFHWIFHLYSELVELYEGEAKRRPQFAWLAHLGARRAAEEGILYLNRPDRLLDAEVLAQPMAIDREKGSDLVNAAKILLSLQAAEACVELGDSVAAGDYLEDAQKLKTKSKKEKREEIAKRINEKMKARDWSVRTTLMTKAILWIQTRAGVRVCIFCDYPDLDYRMDDYVEELANAFKRPYTGELN
ncbi:hypothetical protein BDV96DRAFT_593366 [Lophiotrema nucula]|uniref:Uncharacterized protein n=1 Tax=Lophiotrema nucula TaxID=690887 RepID=A0A6A5ZVA0_9PLEO|nr:hypothetical protein BDV96DRAFT_593366 [Lophiotrema nucula]